MSLKQLAGKPMAGVMLGLVVLGGASGLARADAISDAINRASAQLVNSEVIPPNNHTSAWEGANYTSYNGAILAGLSSAYLANGIATNKTAAESGATALINNVNFLGGSYYSNEVYGLTQVSALQANPNSNPYHDAVLNYFTNTVGSDVSTFVTNLSTSVSQSQINAGYNGLDKTQLTINLAQYTAAAYAVNAPNKVAFRNNLIITLGHVADVDSGGAQVQFYPTEALGAAVWALAKTGTGLDSTTITGPTGLSDPSQNAFGGKKLSDLPAMLAGRIDPTSHTFFAYMTMFPDTFAYTDDTAFGILGLDAADSAGHTSIYAADLAAARLALTGAVDPVTGVTHDNSITSTASGGEFAGNALQALAVTPVPEPASVTLLALGTASLMLRRRRAGSRNGAWSLRN